MEHKIFLLPDKCQNFLQIPTVQGVHEVVEVLLDGAGSVEEFFQMGRLMDGFREHFPFVMDDVAFLLAEFNANEVAIIGSLVFLVVLALLDLEECIARWFFYGFELEDIGFAVQF